MWAEDKDFQCLHDCSLLNAAWPGSGSRQRSLLPIVLQERSVICLVALTKKKKKRGSEGGAVASFSHHKGRSLFGGGDINHL